MSPIDFAGRLLAYCAVTRASVTSWGRTHTRNAAVGGAPASRHLVWCAADVVYDTTTPPDVRQALAHHLGLRLIIEDDHDHLQPL